MNKNTNTPVTMSISWRIFHCYKRLIKQILAHIAMAIVILPAYGKNITCHGRFVNPITDICWSCVLPISIGDISFGKSGGGGFAPRKRDTKNPKSPVCMCSKGHGAVPIPGITVGFWEPVRMVDVTRTPYCMTNLGGILLADKPSKMSSYSRSHDIRRSTHSGFYHLHYYVYPPIYWLELITDFACLEKSTFDVAYMSEFDVTWNDPKMQSLMNPEAIIFGNPLAQAACAYDCASATANFAEDNLFWCAGCYGNLYPLSGANRDFIGGVQNSSLLTLRILAKMHRLGLARKTMTHDSSINGKLCRKEVSLKLPKSQYKLQMVYPKSTSGNIGCWPLGLSDQLYSAFKEYPYDGEDFGYLIWRKTNCCLF